MKKRRENRFTKYNRRICIGSIGIFVFGMTFLNSYEASANIQTQRLEAEINQLKADIDGLDMKYIELAGFDKLYDIANSKGYTYHNSSTALAVVGVQNE